MSNKSRGRGRGSPANARAGLLTGWVFVAVDNNQLIAEGVVLGSIGDHQLVRFEGGLNYSRMMSVTQIEALTLFQSVEEREEFITQWMVMNQTPANDNKNAPEIPPEGYAPPEGEDTPADEPISEQPPEVSIVDPTEVYGAFDASQDSADDTKYGDEDEGNAPEVRPGPAGETHGPEAGVVDPQ